MDFNELLKEKNISKYKLSKASGVPYSTISDISTGKTKLEKCSAETLVRICHILEMHVEDIFSDITYPEIKKKEKGATASKKSKKISPKTNDSNTKVLDNVEKTKRYSEEELTAIFNSLEFKPFRKDVTVRILQMGELAFLVDNIKKKEVEDLYNENKILESKFLLRILDDLCRQYNFPMLTEYDYIRNC